MKKIYYNDDIGTVLIIAPNNYVTYYRVKYYVGSMRTPPDTTYYEVEKTNIKNVYIIEEYVDKTILLVRTQNIIVIGKLFKISEKNFERLLKALQKSKLFTIEIK